jgi:hypothetical protein
MSDRVPTSSTVICRSEKSCSSQTKLRRWRLNINTIYRNAVIFQAYSSVMPDYTRAFVHHDSDPIATRNARNGQSSCVIRYTVRDYFSVITWAKHAFAQPAISFNGNRQRGATVAADSFLIPLIPRPPRKKRDPRIHAGRRERARGG